MSHILNSEDFGLKIYNRFPLKYREDDVNERYALKRYLEALSEGGFKHSIDEINGIANLVDPDKVDAKILPILFEQYGLEVFNGIPEQYLRYLLPKLGEAWSKKGSLSVVEFISSSLSGIRTSTGVNYDDADNPTIDIKLEMDYTLGDYFPDVNQFIRLLEKFIPFYCDVSLLYLYRFDETPNLLGREIDIYKMRESKEDFGYIKGFKGYSYAPLLNMSDRNLNGEFILNDPYIFYDEPDILKDVVTHNLSESGKLKGIEESHHNITIVSKALNDLGNLSMSDKADDVFDLSLIHNENGGLRLKNPEYDDTNAELGIGIHNKAILGVDRTTVDVHEDILKVSHPEDGGFYPLADAYTNMGAMTLNSSFFTNGLTSYDIITQGGVRTLIYGGIEYGL